MGQALGCVTVLQQTVKISESFGKFESVLDPGCHFVPWCIGKGIAGCLTLRLQQLNVPCYTRTKDNVFVTVYAIIQYRALSQKAFDAFYMLIDPNDQIESYVSDVICAIIPKLILDDVYEQKNEIAKAVEEELEKAMSMYGYEIVRTLITDIEPDPHFKQAVNEINAVKYDVEKSRYLAGLVIPCQRRAILDNLDDLGDSVPHTSVRDVMDMELVTQYLDTMKDIGAQSKSSSVFIPHGPGAVKDVAAQIRGQQGSPQSHDLPGLFPAQLGTPSMVPSLL